MKNALASFVVGFIFALGLGLSGMTQPQKVVAFLDVFGAWDPSLMFVMLGSILVHFFSYKLIRKRNSPLLSPEWHVPTKREITKPLIVGGLMFGVGWGLAGYCPGPAVTSLASLDSRTGIFVLSMIAGMYIFKMVDKRLKLNR